MYKKWVNKLVVIKLSENNWFGRDIKQAYKVARVKDKIDYFSHSFKRELTFDEVSSTLTQKEEKKPEDLWIFCQMLSLNLKAHIDLKRKSLRNILSFKVTNYVAIRGSTANPLSWRCLEAERILEISCMRVLFAFHLRYLLTAIAREIILS